jgi:predicted component of type VI protein secretion system
MWENGMTGLTVVARGNSLQVGRTGCDLCFPQDFWLSDQHCLVEDQGGFLMLTDLGSRGGTFVRVKGPTRLSTGDEILIGRTRLRVELVNKPSGFLPATP